MRPCCRVVRRGRARNVPVSEAPVVVAHRRGQERVFRLARHEVVPGVWYLDTGVLCFEVAAVDSANLAHPGRRTGLRAELGLHHPQLDRVVPQVLRHLELLVDRVHAAPDRVVHLFPRDVVNGREVHSLPTCKEAQHDGQPHLGDDWLAGCEGITRSNVLD